MLRLGSQLRLTGREVERFTRITGFVPVGVKSLDDVREKFGGDALGRAVMVGRRQGWSMPTLPD